MRCFLALELSDEARRHLECVQQAMRAQLPAASYPKPENLHVTLKFLGHANDGQITGIYESMHQVKISGRLELAADGLDGFPKRRVARVIVAAMSGSDGVMSTLHDAVEQRCRRLGFEGEQRKYRPHVTLARVARGVDAATQQKLSQSVSKHWPGPALEVREFVLFESQLHPEGSRYIKLATFRFVV